MSAPALLLGFDIGGTKSTVALGDRTGHILDRHTQPTADAETTLHNLIDAARTLIDRHDRPAAVGISVGSPLDRSRGLIQAPPNLPTWIDVPVIAMLKTALGEDLPINLENDADAGALAEWAFGFEKKIDDLIYLTCGTGQGAGLILGGRLHRGRNNLAGEIGHVRLEADGPIGCHKAGSVEGFTCGRALGELAQRRLAKPHAGSPLDDKPIDAITGKDVGEAAMAGDNLALEIVHEVGTRLGHACAILIDVLNPERISLGSLAVRLGDLIVTPCRAGAAAEALATSFNHCTIDAAVLGDRVQDLAALAAAEVAMDHAS